MLAKKMVTVIALVTVAVTMVWAPWVVRAAERAPEKIRAAEVAKWEAAEIVNLGPVVNSPYREMGLAATVDGNTLYFVSDRPGGVGERDIWVTTRRGDQWTPPVNLGPNVNSVAHDGGMSISADGKRLYFGSTRPGGLGGEDLYMTTFVDGQWTPAVNLGRAVNSAHNDAMVYITKDDRELYFHSDRPGGYGDRDIWVSKLRNRRWQPAVNLGPQINTSEAEGNAFLSNDGLSLIFGVGIARVNERLRVASRARVTDRKWTKAVDFGPRMNVSDSFSSCPEVTRDGKVMFFISNRPGGMGESDVWMARIK